MRDRRNIPKLDAVPDVEMNTAGLVDLLIAIGRERQRIEGTKAARLRGDEDTREPTAPPSRQSRIPSVTM